MAQDHDTKLLEGDASAVFVFVAGATSSSQHLSSAERHEFERAETSIVEARRHAESAAGSLKVC